MSILLKEIDEDHLQQIAKIFLDCLQIQYKDILPDEIRQSFTLSSSIDLWKKGFDTVPPMQMLGAFVDGQLTGFTKFGPDSSNPEIGYLASLYVSPHFGRRGIGKTLLENALKQLSRYKVTQLWVFATNEPAINLYETYKFRETGVQQMESVWGSLQIQMQLDNS